MTTTLSNKQNGSSVPSVGNLVNNLFRDGFHRIFEENFSDNNSFSTGKVPVNIKETDKEYQIHLVVPGCRKEDFKISFEKKLLTVVFDRTQAEDTNEKVAWTRNEYVQPSFSKTFITDDSVDPNNITATYQDGILRISLGKNEQARSAARQIEIK